MNNYSWGLDGFGRQHIDKNDERIVIMCALPTHLWDCIELLEKQDESTNTKRD